MADDRRVPHAVMLSGVAGIGKMNLARAFAMYLHCRHRSNGEACGVCPSCRQHLSHNNPDLHFVYPVKKINGKGYSSLFYEEWKSMLDNHPLMPAERWNELIEAGNTQPAIYVEESQEIIQQASLSTYKEDYNIFIIWQPESMRVETANKLLKVIEEPYPDTVFILVSDDDSKVLPTIYSRTRHFNLKPLNVDETTSYLLNKGVAPHHAANAARLSEGSLSRAEQIAFHPEELEEFGDAFRQMMRYSYAAKVAELHALTDSIALWGRRRICRWLDYCARMIRENFIYNLRMPQLNLLTPEEEQFSSRFAPFIHYQNVEEINYEISRTYTDIERNGNAKIVIFDFALMMTTLLRRKK